MSDNWYYSMDGKSRIGPMPLHLMQVFAQGGAIQPNYWVLRPGSQKWEQAGGVAELFAVADALPADAPAASATRLTGVWGGQVMNDAGEVENDAFIYSAAGNPVHGYQGQDGRLVMVEVTHVGQVIPYVSPRESGRLTVQAFKVTPTGVAWQAQDYSVKSGGLAMPGSFVSSKTSQGVNTYESQLRGDELDVQTVSQWTSDMTDNIRDFGGGGANFHFGNQNTIWKRGTLRKISDDPNYLLRRQGW